MSLVENAKKIRNYFLHAFPKGYVASYGSGADYVIELRIPNGLRNREAIEFAKALGTDPRQGSMF